MDSEISINGNCNAKVLRLQHHSAEGKRKKAPSREKMAACEKSPTMSLYRSLPQTMA
jgi:hypothetical protein